VRLTGVLLCSIFSLGAAPPAALNVLDFGAKPDGETDATAAFQKALDQAGKTGDKVFVPAGRFMIRGHLNIPDFVELVGTFDTPPRTWLDHDDITKHKGSIIYCVEGKGDASAAPFITLHAVSQLSGLIIYYPEQNDPEKIAEYPWCIRADGDNCTIRNVLIVNPYQAVDFGTKPSGRHYINGLYAQPLKTGLFIDKCFDVGRIENVHFWPFWTEKAMAWTKANGTAFVIARTDWEYMTNCFDISYKVGYHFIANKDGPGNAILTQCGSDIGPCAVRVDQTQGHAGVSFTNSQFMAGIEISPENQGPVKFTACGFWGVGGETNSHVVSHSNGNVTLTACHFISWAQAKKDAPCIAADHGSVTINGCEFLDREESKIHADLGEELESAVIMGNQFRSKPRIENRSKGDVQIGLNATRR
jgi:hypothetical protein